MSSDVYPGVRGLTLSYVKTPTFDTIVHPSPGGYETRLPQMYNPLWEWKLQYDYLYDDSGNILSGLVYTDLKTLLGFYLAHRGQWDDFLWRDPSDNYVGPAMVSGSPNIPFAQLPLISSGGVYYSAIQRNMGGFFEDVTDLHGAITVYANGAAKTSPGDYSVHGPGLALPGYSYAGKYLTWTGTPTGPITAQFNFYFRVRFGSDDQDFEQFLGSLTPASTGAAAPTGIWSIGGSHSRGGKGTLVLRTSRVANV